MKYRPILFSAPMVRALLDGSKTQTRRVINPQPEFVLEPSDYKLAVGGKMLSGKKSEWLHWNGSRIAELNDSRCPYGQPGDRLWVREAWAEPTSLDPGPTFYRADYPFNVPSHFQNILREDQIKWKPSIHMRRDQSRITLEVTGVRVERLQDISEADAFAEGTPAGFWEYGNGEGTETAKESYECLWEFINGPGSWEPNPWVWVIKFKRVEGGEA